MWGARVCECVKVQVWIGSRDGRLQAPSRRRLYSCHFRRWGHSLLERGVHSFHVGGHWLALVHPAHCAANLRQSGKKEWWSWGTCGGYFRVLQHHIDNIIMGNEEQSSMALAQLIFDPAIPWVVEKQQPKSQNSKMSQPPPVPAQWRKAEWPKQWQKGIGGTKWLSQSAWTSSKKWEITHSPLWMCLWILSYQRGAVSPGEPW